MKFLLKGCRYLVTQNAERTVLERVDVLLQEGRILAVGSGLTGDEELDCTGRIVMPGLVNCHTHLAMGLLRGLSEGKELHAWLKEIVAAEQALTNEQLLEGSLLGCRESLRFGTTTVADMYNPMGPTFQAVLESGIRAWLFIAFPTLAMRQSGILDIQPEEVAKEVDQFEGDARVTIGLGPHAPYSCSDQLLKSIDAIAKKRQMIKSIHFAETRQEQYERKGKSGLLPAQHLDTIGFLDRQTLLIHSIWLTKEELRLISDRGSQVIHCPTSNMKLASGGVMPLKEMHATGINVGLGTDGVVTNDNLDMFEEMKVAALLHKQHYWDPAMAGAQRVLDLATRDGATCLGFDGGCIEKGKVADIITIDIPLHLQPIDASRVVRHLVYSANGNDVNDVMVGGKLLVRDKHFI